MYISGPCVELKENNMGTFKSEVDLASSTMRPKFFCSRIGHLKNPFSCLSNKRGG